MRAMTKATSQAARLRGWPGWLLLGSSLLFFLPSLLVWVSAPTEKLWIGAILITEWGHFAALVGGIGAVLALGFGFRVPALLLALAALNCASPFLRATMLARRLPAACTAAFGPAVMPAGAQAQPLSLADAFRGVSPGGVESTELTYATDGGKPLKLDLYQATNVSELQPLVVVVHGGSWNGGSKDQLPDLNRALARQHYAVAAMNYRHAPKYPSPAAVEDVFRAIDFLAKHAAEARLDLSRIVLLGRSAGGQVALSAGYAGRLPGLRGVVSLYGPTDLGFGYDNPSRRWVLDSKRVLEDYLGGTPTTAPDQYAAASPINFVDTNTPPTLLIHGGLDPMVWPRHSELLAARLQQAERPHLYLALPWATHGCDVNLSGPSGQLSLYAIERFLANAFASRTP